MEHIIISSYRKKKARFKITRDELARQVSDWLKSGGKIKTLSPADRSSIDLKMDQVAVHEWLNEI